jgi:hypothetical protein
LAIPALRALDLVSVPTSTRLPRVCHHQRIRPAALPFLPPPVGPEGVAVGIVELVTDR